MKNKAITLIICSLILLAGCSKEIINENIENAKGEVTNQIGQSVQTKIDQQVEQVSNSIESKLDPEFGKLRNDMINTQEAALVYYKINNSFPTKELLQSFFDESFSKMQIEYTITEDKLIATIKYTGDKYNKEKIKDITIDKSKNQ